jgi:hypothetical protein
MPFYSLAIDLKHPFPTFKKNHHSLPNVIQSKKGESKMNRISDIILEDHVVALNDLLVACQRSANHLMRSAKLLEGQHDMASWFNGLYYRRHRQCDGIQAILRTINHLPKEPDPDREMIADLSLRAKTFLSDDEKVPLIRKAMQMDSELAKHLDSALQLEWLAEIRQRLDRFHLELKADKQSIENAL